MTYVSGSTIYLEVGSKQGVKEGTIFTVVRAGEGVSGTERVYLAHLANRLSLTPDRTAALEARTAAAIDAAPVS